MLFTAIMSKKKIFLYASLALLLFISWFFLDSNSENEDFSERVKISLRDVGNQLLLSNTDSTSLVLPIIAINPVTYKVSFQEQLSFEPSMLVAIVKRSFQKSKLPNYYRVAVVQCADAEVAYSYQMSAEEENTIIPCAGRFLPDACYTIQLKFTNRLFPYFNRQLVFVGLLLLLLVFMIEMIAAKRKIRQKLYETNVDSTKIGLFQFYPEQNKLVKQATEISLSKKECELLAIFAANPNQIIKRDELTKKVWEDNGVFVGRSLDTYISKLRKKLKEDTSIKIINIHGVGYKLELH